jgi:hypothetical protein
MTEPDRKFEEEIRRALYAAGDLVVPAGDGLNKIRERAARQPPAPGWFAARVARLPRQLARGAGVAATEIAATTRGYSSLGPLRASVRRWPGQARHALRTPGMWLRPALATAAALLLVIGVTLSIPRLRATVGAQLDSAFGNSSGHSPGGALGGHMPSSGSHRASAPVSCRQQYETWEHGPVQDSMGSLRAVLKTIPADRKSGNAAGVRSGMRELVPAALGLASHPLPPCVDPAGLYDTFVTRVYTAGSGARSAKAAGAVLRAAASLNQVTKLGRQLAAEINRVLAKN